MCFWLYAVYFKVCTFGPNRDRWSFQLIIYLSSTCLSAVSQTLCEGLDVKREHAWPFARKNWLISVFKSCVLYSKVELLRKCHSLSQNDFQKTRVCPSLWGPMGIGPCPSLFSGNLYQARLQADHGWWAALLHNGTADHCVGLTPSVERQAQHCTIAVFCIVLLWNRKFNFLSPFPTEYLIHSNAQITCSDNL